MEEIVPNVSNSITVVMRQTVKVPCHCKICDGPARYSYYGAIVCESCKMFFKRNGKTEQRILKCDFDHHCEININNRRICPSCRLAKCFANGMLSEMIRCARTKKIKTNQKKHFMSDLVLTTLMRTVEKNQPEQISTLNLLRSDQSTLSIDQWNLLSNLIHCFDEYSAYSFVQRFIQEQNGLPLKLRFKSSSVKDFFTSVKGKVQLVFEKNRDFLSLSSHDRTTLLRTTVEHTTSLGGMFTLRQHQLFDYPSFYKAAEIIFRPTAAAFTKRVIDQLDPDHTFIKIILAILAFSTINYTVYTEFNPTNLINVKTILSIQDMYTELAWRYLLYKCGYDQVVIRFSNLIRCLFLINNAIVEAHESQQFTKMIDTVIKQTEQTLSL